MSNYNRSKYTGVWAATLGKLRENERKKKHSLVKCPKAHCKYQLVTTRDAYRHIAIKHPEDKLHKHDYRTKGDKQLQESMAAISSTCSNSASNDFSMNDFEDHCLLEQGYEVVLPKEAKPKLTCTKVVEELIAINSNLANVLHEIDKFESNF